MMMNHLVIYYLEIAFCMCVASKHEGECDLSARDPEAHLQSQNACSISRA